MLYNIDFELAALVLLIILIVFYRTKNCFKIQQNRYFGFFMISMFWAAVINVISCAISTYKDNFSTSLISIVCIITYISSIISILFFYMYTISITGKLKKIILFKYKLIFIPAITAIVATILSPVTKTIFMVTEKGEIVNGSGNIIIAAVSIFYALLALFELFSSRKLKMSKKYKIVILLFIFMYIIAYGLEYKNIVHDTFIVYYVSSIAILIMYLAVHNPDYYIDISNGLLNREAFKLMVSEDIEYNIPFNCISLQLDDYKTLNEVHGIKKCDLLVREIGTFLKKSFPKANVFLITDSQFMIVDKDKIDFPTFDDLISERFTEMWLIDDTEIKLSKSICALSYPEFYGNIDQLLAIVKFALEESFKTNSMIIVGDYIINKMNHNIAVEKAVEKAIEANKIQVYYQPIYSAKDKRITTAEALARLFDDELGFVPPDEFIRVAEENGSILRLGRQIFEKVCIFLKNNDIQELGINYIEVNLSPIQCMQKELASELINIAESYNLPMSYFNLEITESATTESKDHIRINMDMLCDKHTTFSLDDYGTGFSNITAIMALPFQYVKIDKSIVWAYFDNTNSILEHLIHMFKKEKLLIITEGVETKEQKEKLIEMGCDYLQGFYFSKAIPGDDFISYISV